MHKQQIDKKILFEQYKLFVESSEQVTVKRQNANKFYLAVNAVLFTAAGYLTSYKVSIFPVLISVVGILTSIAWNRIICSYKNLNKAKFKIIHELEKSLPYQLFKQEDKHLIKQKYYLLTDSEKIIPYLFYFLHTVTLLYILFIWCFA